VAQVLGAEADTTADTTVDTEVKSTRERILEVAMDLFIEKGYDKTSLREIAEQLGFTKAALYYHFSSKEDILMALHRRFHEFGRDALLKMGQEPPTLAVWADLLDSVIQQMLGNRKIFLLHERNQAAFEGLHDEEHEAEHDDMQAQLKRVLSDDRIGIEDRVRMASSFGAVIAGIFLAGDAFDAVPSPELGLMLQDVVRDLLR
jgi:AcrR family transcriptional regulator